MLNQLLMLSLFLLSSAKLLKIMLLWLKLQKVLVHFCKNGQAQLYGIKRRIAMCLSWDRKSSQKQDYLWSQVNLNSNGALNKFTMLFMLFIIVIYYLTFDQILFMLHDSLRCAIVILLGSSLNYKVTSLRLNTILSFYWIRRPSLKLRNASIMLTWFSNLKVLSVSMVASELWSKVDKCTIAINSISMARDSFKIKILVVAKSKYLPSLCAVT